MTPWRQFIRRQPSDQAAIASVVPNTEAVVRSLSAGLTKPAYARPASAETQSVHTVLPSNEAIATNNSPDAVVVDTAAGQAPVEVETEQGGGAYPHSGKTTASVNMRSSEQKNSEIIAVIPGNTAISFNECGKWWCGVEYEGKTGLSVSDLLTARRNEFPFRASAVETC